jgi:hypothetical protein
MTLTEDQIQKIEQYAAALLPPSDIAVLIEIETCYYELFKQKCLAWIGSREYSAFHRGRLKTKSELYSNVVRLAKAGSPIAEELATRHIREQLE